MKSRWIRAAAVAAILVAAGPRGEAAGLEKLLPGAEGLEPAGEARVYDPDTLFEYVNGDSFNYVNFHFVELLVREYAYASGGRVTVEIYRHGGLNDAFGIYGYERPAEGPFLDVGAQGYREPGLLHFFESDCYVKLKASNLGEREREILEGLAREISSRIPGEPTMPPALGLLPRRDRVPHSERFVARSFLGHGFLESAFTADYRSGQGEHRVFLIEAGSDDEARSMLDSWLALARKRGEEPSEQHGVYRFHDPYHRADGPLHLERRGRYLFGLFAEDAGLAREFLARVEKRLG